jgi:hypothetical protein
MSGSSANMNTVPRRLTRVGYIVVVVRQVDDIVRLLPVVLLLSELGPEVVKVGHS